MEAWKGIPVQLQQEIQQIRFWITVKQKGKDRNMLRNPLKIFFAN